MDFNGHLIELVKGYRLLYDESDPLYGSTLNRDRVWKDIAGKLNVTDTECKKAWVLLREGYRRALKKQRAALRDPKKMAKLTPKWTYEDDLAFLAPHLKHRSLTLSPEYIHINLEENPNALDQLQPNAAAQKKSKRSRTNESTSKITCANQSYSNTLIKYILNKTTKKDDVQHFFESMSATVQMFPPRDRAIAKAKVFEVISQMELEILSRENAPSLQCESSPTLYVAEQAVPQSDLFASLPPEALPSSSPSILQPNQSAHQAPQEPVIDISLEPQEMFTIKFEPESE